MANIRQTIGEWGEEVTSRIVTTFGYRIICRNYRITAGEIDLVCQDNGALVFIEVKTRKGDRYGPGEEAVSEEKERRLAITAHTYINDCGNVSQAFRIDLAIIEEQAPGFYAFRYLPGAIGDVHEDPLDAP